MTTRHQFDEALKDLRCKIIRLGSMVETRIVQGVDSLAKRDMKLADQVIKGDTEVNDLQADIEEQCMLLIATQQPLAKDLRKIVTGFKISIYLERIGDLAVDIAKITLRIGDSPLIKPLIDIPRMAAIVGQMISKGLDSYIKEDEALAREMSEMDDEVDHLYKQIFRELLVFMMEDPKTINQATYLLFFARFLERMGDYCTNIAEEICYLINGKRTDLNQ
ncbi:MAG: phosphate signaling complex protein PhoU [Thermincola sp.]|nr:phosphate signaling complex protein PhoU [Thermincola sp.]MDT3702420.1 phosphate signaling complex protein PhoU [Thermincola sp.]